MKKYFPSTFLKHGTEGLQRVPYKVDIFLDSKLISSNKFSLDEDDLETHEGPVKIPRPEGSKQIWGGGSIIDLNAI